MFIVLVILSEWKSSTHLKQNKYHWSTYLFLNIFFRSVSSSEDMKVFWVLKKNQFPKIHESILFPVRDLSELSVILSQIILPAQIIVCTLHQPTIVILSLTYLLSHVIWNESVRVIDLFLSVSKKEVFTLFVCHCISSAFIQTREWLTYEYRIPPPFLPLGAGLPERTWEGGVSEPFFLLILHCLWIVKIHQQNNRGKHLVILLIETCG